MSRVSTPLLPCDKLQSPYWLLLVMQEYKDNHFVWFEVFDVMSGERYRNLLEIVQRVKKFLKTSKRMK